MHNLKKGRTLLIGATLILIAAALALAITDFAAARALLARAVRAAALFLPQTAGMAAIGWLLIDRLHPQGRRSLLGSLVASALGLGVISHLFLLLGLAGLLFPWVAWIVFAALALLGAAELWNRREDYLRILRTGLAGLDRVSWLHAAGLLLLAVYLVYPLLADVFVPPLENDEIAYHLPIARIFIDNHRIVPIPFIPYSNWPTGFEMVYAFQLLFATDTLAHLMTYLTFLLTAGGVGGYLYRSMGGAAALFGALLVAGTITFLNLSGTGMIDVPVAMFTFFAVLCLLEWLRKGADGWLVLSAVLVGFAASTKLNAAVFAVIFGLIVLARLAIQGRFRAGVGRFALYGLVSGAVVLPWYVKSWIVIGSPVWPFLPEVFGARDWDAVGQAYLIQFIRAPNRPLTLLNWLTGFADLALDPGRYGYSYRTGPALLSFSPMLVPALLVLKGRHRTVFLAAAAVFAALYTNWFLTTQQNRFFLPAVPVFALLLGLGAGAMFRHRARILGNVLMLAVLVYFAAAAWPLDPDERTLIAGNWQYQAGKVSQAAYLAERLVIFDAVRFLNTRTDPDAYVLLALYEPRGYYLEREYFWLNPVSQRNIRMEQYGSATAFIAELQRRGFTHILFNPRWLSQLDEVAYSSHYTPMMNEVLERSTRVFEARGIAVYELAGAE